MTIIVHHTCLDGGIRREGSYLDCDACRSALVHQVRKAGGGYSDRETSREVSQPGEEVRSFPLTWVHQTVADTEPSDGPGGEWVVSCTCGWKQTGHYARTSGELVALRLARLVGRKHEEYPEEP